METIGYIADILRGLAVIVPLVVALVVYVKKATKAKNWSSLVQMVLSLMKEAESSFSSGASKKEYVMASIKSMAASIGAEYDEDVLSEMIDSICLAAKVLDKKGEA